MLWKVINHAGVTERWGLLSHAQNAVMRATAQIVSVVTVAPYSLDTAVTCGKFQDTFTLLAVLSPSTPTLS